MLVDTEDESSRARRLLIEYLTRVRGIDLRHELDAAATELLAAFDAAGVAALLLKGPVLARLLYEPGEQRMYNDIDILVEPAALERARVVLRERGSTCLQEELGVQDGGSALHAEEWTVGTVPVDLHWRLPEVAAPDGAAWNALYASHQLIDLEGHRVPTLGHGGLALHIAIHAAHHGSQHSPGLRDLDLALERWPPAVWGGAAALARELGATHAFAAGLQLAPAGRKLARALELPNVSQRNRIAPREWPRGTSHLRALANAGSLSARLRVVRRALLPPPKWIVWEYPWARRWPPLQIAAYAVHLMRAPLWGSRALRFHRRHARSSG
jgi:hypothetical protein